MCLRPHILLFELGGVKSVYEKVLWVWVTNYGLGFVLGFNSQWLLAQVKFTPVKEAGLKQPRFNPSIVPYKACVAQLL